MHPRPSRPVTLGVVGDSAAGKTTLVRGVASILGEERVNHLSADDYHALTRAERRARRVTALDPEANHLDIFAQHLKLLCSGQPVLKPTYDHSTGTLGSPEYISPRPYLLVEGLLPLANYALRECFDVAVFLEPDERLRQRWKRSRDVRERGYSETEVDASLARREPDSRDFVQPQREYADIVIAVSQPPGAADIDDRRLDVRHVLRPTLPQLDFSAVLDDARPNEIALEMTRDGSQPVDVLDIRGSVSDSRAALLEALLWSRIPEAIRERAPVGRIVTGGQPASSHSLALSQLLVAFHVAQTTVAVTDDALAGS